MIKKLCPVLLFAAGSPFLIASPAPAPTGGPQVHLTLTGIQVFWRLSNDSYRLIMPNVTAHSHMTYIRLLASAHDPAATTFPTYPFVCDKKNYVLIPLLGDRLSLDPNSEIASQPPLHDAGLKYVPSLAELAPAGADMRNEFKKAAPVLGLVSAVLDMDRGALQPGAPQDYEVSIWDYKDGVFNANKPRCSVPGLRWELELKPNVTKFFLRSETTGRTLALNVADGEVTALAIANSLAEDALCPHKVEQDKDKHFQLYYDILTVQTSKKYFPHKKKKCPATEFVPVILSHRGSNCIGAQWP